MWLVQATGLLYRSKSCREFLSACVLLEYWRPPTHLGRTRSPHKVRNSHRLSAWFRSISTFHTRCPHRTVCELSSWFFWSRTSRNPAGKLDRILVLATLYSAAETWEASPWVCLRILSGIYPTWHGLCHCLRVLLSRRAKNRTLTWWISCIFSCLLAAQVSDFHLRCRLANWSMCSCWADRWPDFRRRDAWRRGSRWQTGRGFQHAALNTSSTLSRVGWGGRWRYLGVRRRREHLRWPGSWVSLGKAISQHLY